LIQGLSYDDVLLVPKHGVLHSRKDADISSELVSGHRLEVPIISVNMPAVTEWNMAASIYDAGGFGILHRFNSSEESAEEYIYVTETDRNCGASFGYRDWSRVEALYNVGCRIFCLDVAHGDHELTLAHVEEFNKQYPYCKLIVGNIATGQAGYDLIQVGVDALKVGIGPGAACRTREVTGFGVPQLSAILDVAELKSMYPNVKIIADGGIKNSGDIVKALAAGADTVMIGSLLAGCDEAPNPGEYYGSASHKVNGHRAPEGVHGEVERKGSVKDVIKELAWGIRSGLSYGGATNLVELRQNAEFIRVTAAGQYENQVRI
jgi:IMP dehydrogenase